MGALCYGGCSELGRADRVARDPAFQQETQEKHQRHHDVTHSVEDYWPLRVPEPIEEDKRK